MSEFISSTTTDDKQPAEGLVFDDTDFVWDDQPAMVLDEDGNWVENAVEPSGQPVAHESNNENESKFGDMPIMFAEYAVAGIRPEDMSDYPEEAALYTEWLNSLDENTKLIIEERKRAQGRYEIVRAEMLKSSAALLEGKLPAEQAEKLGSEKYVLGVNQSAVFSLEDAKDYLREDNGVGLGIYGLDQRFLLVDENSTAVDSDYTERVMVGGYYQNSNIGRFIVAIPMDGRERYGTPHDAISEADTIEDFTQPTSEAGGRSVNPKYIAGFIDSSGVYHENNNFGISSEPDF